MFLLAALLLSGCSFHRKESSLPPLPLLPPPGLAQHWQLSQSVIFYPNCDETSNCADPKTLNQSDLPMPPLQFIAAWSVTEQGLSLVGLTLAGQVLMTLGYDGEQLVEEYSPAFSSRGQALKAPGRDIISLLQLSYWPLDMIHRQLQTGPWLLVARGADRDLYLAQHRVLTINATPLVDETQIGQVITINNIPQRYRLKITTLTQTALP